MNLMVHCFHGAGDASVSWTMPDGFQVDHRVFKHYKHNRWSDKLGCNIYYDCDYEEPNKNDFRSLVPNYFHSWDAYVLRELVRRCDFYIWTIHDAFRVHPNNVDSLLQSVREIYADIFKGNWLEKHFQEMFGVDIELTKDLSIDDILGSTHLLT
jgi:DNA-directed RNA polymerase